MQLPEKVNYILSRLRAAGYEAYAVGGCVRDALLGIEPHDWDICTAAAPDETHAVFSGHSVRDTGLQHGTVTLVLDGEPFEITTFRVEGSYSDSRHPDSVRFTASIAEDLARRDFTINAMAYNGERGLVDPFGGQADLAAGLIRCVGDPAARFTEDALRILRAMRFAARFGFGVEPETAKAMRTLSGRLRLVAPERVRAELEGLLTAPGAADVLLGYPDVPGVVIPEILPCVGFDQLNPYHIYDVWEHTVRAVENIPPEPILRWTMLLHDLGKPPCFSEKGEGRRGHFYGHGRVSAVLADEIMMRLRFSNGDREAIRELVENHDRFIAPNKRAVRRELGRVGREQFDRSLLVRIADIKAQNPVYGPERLAEMEHIRALADEIEAADECVSLKTLAVRGDDLLAIGYRPGPALGAELRRLLSVVLDEPEKNDRETLLAIAARDV